MIPLSLLSEEEYLFVLWWELAADSRQLPQLFGCELPFDKQINPAGFD